MRFNIPYGKHHISNNDVKQVVSALKSDFITQGKISKHFEKALASNVNSKFSSVFNSASSALIAACLALDIKKVMRFGQHQSHIWQRLIVQFMLELILSL